MTNRPEAQPSHRRWKHSPASPQGCKRCSSHGQLSWPEVKQSPQQLGKKPQHPVILLFPPNLPWKNKHPKAQQPVEAATISGVLGGTRRHPAGEGGEKRRKLQHKRLRHGAHKCRMISAAAKTLSVLEKIKDGVQVGFVFL